MDHLKLLSPFMALIAAVWVLRLTVGLMPAPAWLIRIFSVSLAVALAVMLAVVVIHLRNFGGYSSVVLSTFILVAWGQLLIIGAVVGSTIVGVDTIYTAPEFSIGNDPLHLRHVVGHLTFGIGFGTLVGSATGSFMLFFLRLMSPLREPTP